MISYIYIYILTYDIINFILITNKKKLFISILNLS